MKNKICEESFVWDMHIHTCECPKGSSEFCQLTVKEYVDKLESLFLSHLDLKMISFTDHNFISIKVYKEFKKRNLDIKLIPGIEVDICLNKENMKDFRHVIFYFNDELFDLERHSKLINDKLNKKPIYFYDFLDFLITELKGVSFLMSPHFMKQGKRDLDYDWNDEEYTQKNITKYIDQLFCFWETSSVKNISAAEEFLKEFENEQRISIISFSDSNSMNKLESYLDNPCQYFNSLPTFNGLRMVGSDCRRILRNKSIVSNEEKGKYIGRVVQGNNIIEFSSKLNTVIGGRGSGKSLLIDSIALTLCNNYKDDNLIENERKQFIQDLNYETFDMKNKNLKEGGFKIDYFNQGYVLNLFKKETNLISSIYFKDEFLKLKNYNIDNKKSDILTDLDFNQNTVIETNDNIVSIIDVIKEIKENDDCIKFKKSSQVNKTLGYKDILIIKKELNKPTILHKELKENPRIIEAQNKLILTIDEELYKFNQQKIIDSINIEFKEKYEKKILELNLEKKKKKELLKRIKIEINNKSVKYVNRVRIMNCIFNLENKYSEIDRTTSAGYKESQFIFERKIKVENFENYLYRIFNDYFDSNKIKSSLGIDKKDRTQLLKLIEVYCFNADNVIMESKKISNLDSELFNLSSLKIEVEDNIYYKATPKSKEISLRSLSPGTKANLLMEYIVFKESSIPLLIDQPEDNIDNSTIYGKLTLWFENLKQKRQVIVATHDPNLVINADSENVIICNQESENKFSYSYGALEYGNNIEKIADILDGGKEAIERRLIKYGM